MLAASTLPSAPRWILISGARRREINLLRNSSRRAYGIQDHMESVSRQSDARREHGEEDLPLKVPRYQVTAVASNRETTNQIRPFEKAHAMRSRVSMGDRMGSVSSSAPLTTTQLFFERTDLEERGIRTTTVLSCVWPRIAASQAKTFDSLPACPLQCL